MNQIKLIIADDHELFRNGLKELLKNYDDVDVVACVADGEEFFEALDKDSDIDIVLLDITMPSMDGFEVLHKIKRLNASVKPIIISMHDDGIYIARCAKSGAYGYLLKNTDQEELIKVIRIVNQGKKYFSPSISEKIINFMSVQNVSENILSNKEKEVLRLFGEALMGRKV